MATLSSAEQQALLWPIQAKGKVDRLQPLNDPTISQFYQNSMEQGRFLESSIADANLWLLQKKTLLNEYIISYTHMNQLAVDGQLGHHHRVPKYIADGISILQTAKRLIQEIVALENAVNGNITKILAIEQSLTNMVQIANNSLANLLNNICNWGIPGLPSIPNLFPDAIWNWNGFMFSPLALFAALKSNTHFNFNFTFKNCSFGPTSTSNLFVTDPLSTETYSGLVYGSANYLPPFNGSITPAAQDLSDPAFISQMQGTTVNPVYSPSFNPNVNMLGNSPDPHFVISNWQMPATTYTSSIVSITPQLRSNTVFLTDPDYSNPNLTVRQPVLQKALAHSINLAQIVASNYDPFVVSAWLIYLDLTRHGRGGVWIPNFQAAYDQYLQPSISTLNVQPVPWNDVLPGTGNFLWNGTWAVGNSYVPGDIVVFNGVNYLALVDSTGLEPDTNPTSWGSVPAGTVYSNAPVIALISTLQSLPTTQRNHALWQLSYIEASLLGYTRDSNFDAYQDNSYLTGPTGNSLDYQPTAITSSQAGLVLGAGVAEFPVPITFPAAMSSTLNQVITIATANINNDVHYQSPRLANRFTYDQFAQATPVDRFSQFWRDFATNLTHFLAQDPYLVEFAITYPEILDGALDPLASATDLASYNSLLADVSSRSRSWVPGTPLPLIPVQPVTGLTNNSTPDVNNNGWILPPTELDPVAFLARPDIIVLPIPVQIAMLRTNLSYAGVNLWAQQMSASIQNQISIANGILAATQLTGFFVQINCGAITQTSVTSNVLTVVAPNTYQPGDNVLLNGTAESFLNGQIVTVLAASATQFTANFTNGNYSNTSDTGTVALVTEVPAGASYGLTSVAASIGTIAVYTGTITGGAANAYAGLFFTVTGFTNSVNNVQFALCTASTATTLTLVNSVAVVEVHAATAITGSTPVEFDFTELDITGNVTNRSTFTIQTAGNYTVSGQITFEATTPTSGDGVYTVVVTQQVGGVGPHNPVYAASSNPTLAAPQILGISSIVAAGVGDVFQVVASHNFPSTQLVNDCSSFFSMTLSAIAVPQTESTADEGTDATNTFTVSNPLPAWFVGTVLPPLTAVSVQPDGTVSPVDTFVPAVSSITIDASNNVTVVFAGAHHFVTTPVPDRVVFSGLNTASFLNGFTATVTAAPAGQITAHLDVLTHAAYATTADTGSVLYALDTSGAVKAPFVDGVTVQAAAAGTQVQVANSYGNIFSATGESFPTGSILYVGAAGLLTNSFTGLFSVGGWIIVVGKAVSTGSFLFEPNIPSRTTIL